MSKSGSASIPPLRKLAGIFTILAIAIIFLSLYFFKYIPGERKSFHHSAFLELKQVETALQERNKAYITAIQNFLKQKGPPDLAPLSKYFTYTGYPDTSVHQPVLKKIGSYKIGYISIEQDPLSRKWKIGYRVMCNKDTVASLSKNIDSVMTNLVTAYRDIFSDYLLIKAKHSDRQRIQTDKIAASEDDLTDEFHNGEIIFNPGNLSVDYLVNMDSLMKKSDGFSLLNIHDVAIEGNPYKMFLYPLGVGRERIILAGLISEDHYNQGYRKIPFNLVAMAGVLILLILIHLPILKIYILGPYERIRDIDIRFIIGTYFVAAFVGFFLFSNSFLNRADRAGTKRKLEKLSDEITQHFVSEISVVCNQLSIFDHSFYAHIENSNPVLSLGHQEDSMQMAYFPSDSLAISSIFKPAYYPYLNNVFWIDQTGKWVARWGYKKFYSRTPLIKVGDRKYFSDFVNKQNLHLTLSPYSSFTIQPTLSRLDGEYTITVAIPSDTTKSDMFKKKWKSSQAPLLIGMGSDMNFVCNALVPPGYNFSIINENGDVLFDSKPGRAMLSNIVKEVDDPSEILQATHYRNTRYLNSVQLRGKPVSMQCNPLKGFPYTLLTYYSVSQTEDTHEHLIGLSVILMVFILFLLVFSTVVNQWSKKRNLLLQAPRLNFEWLYPAITKQAYYWHLIRWMTILLLIFLFSWIIVESFFSSYEFSLLFITLLFPFYVVLHYYLVREKFYTGMDMKPKSRLTYKRLPLPLFVLLSVILVAFNAYAIKFAGSFVPVLVTQLLWLLAITRSVRYLPPPGAEKEQRVRDDRFLRPYCAAIVMGVVMITVIPALGIICMLRRQETSLESYSTRLDMARMINARRLVYNQRLTDYNFPLQDSLYRSALKKLKFQYGIYFLTGDSVFTTGPFEGSPATTVAPGYILLHQLFFPEGGISAKAELPGLAADSSWYFFAGDAQSEKQRGPQLVFHNNQDGITGDVIRLAGDFSTNWNAVQLMFHDLCSMDGLHVWGYIAFLWLGLLLAYMLTFSLSRRIFLIDLFMASSTGGDTNNFDEDLLLLLKGQQVLGEPIKHTGPGILEIIYRYEHSKSVQGKEDEILSVSKLLQSFYSNIWGGLSAREKFILFDFAIDGFTNYKNSLVLHGLLQKKILLFRDGRLSLMSISFREFVLSEKKDPGITQLEALSAKKDSWRQFKIPLLLILSFIGLFIFITQDMIYQKVTGLFTSISSLIPLLGSIFSNGNGKEEGKKDD